MKNLSSMCSCCGSMAVPQCCAVRGWCGCNGCGGRPFGSPLPYDHRPPVLLRPKANTVHTSSDCPHLSCRTEPQYTFIQYYTIHFSLITVSNLKLDTGIFFWFMYWLYLCQITWLSWRWRAHFVPRPFSRNHCRSFPVVLHSTRVNCNLFFQWISQWLNVMEHIHLIARNRSLMRYSHTYKIIKTW